MATEQGKAAARRRAEAEMAQRGWNQSDLARESRVDPKTVSTFLSGSRWPARATLAKIDEALELTRGTLAGIGDESQPAVPAQDSDALIAELDEEDLLAELAYRVRRLKRENTELRTRLDLAWPKPGQPDIYIDLDSDADRGDDTTEASAEDYSLVNRALRTRKPTPESAAAGRRLLASLRSQPEETLRRLLYGYTRLDNTGVMSPVEFAREFGTVDPDTDPLTEDRQPSAGKGRRQRVPGVQARAAREEDD